MVKRLLLILSLLLAVAVPAWVATIDGKAATGLIGCFGAPADYIAHFDTVRGQSKNGQVDYPYPTFYQGPQTWATPRGEFPSHHSEHFHREGCVPNGVTFTDANPWRYVDSVLVFHNVADYDVTSLTFSAVYRSPTGTNSSQSLASATPAQLAEIQAAMDASADPSHNVQKVYQSYPITAPTRNGFKELRGGIHTVKSGPSAVYLEWRQDERLYWTDNYASLGPPVVEPHPNQTAIRVRAQLVFPKSGDPSVLQEDYSHSGWCGMDGVNGTGNTTGSADWTRATVARIWPDTQAKRVCLYVTDGGGPALLMIDPDLHGHYDAPTPTCPNVDAHGNCLGVWFWQPSNARHELFGNVQQDVTIPASVIASLSPGLHRLVFKSDDFPECVRRHDFKDWNLCAPDVRGPWSNVVMLPFRVA